MVVQPTLAIDGGRPIREDSLIFGAPQIGDDEIQEVVATLRSGWIGHGPKCERFEREFAAYVQAPAAVSLASCTAGLHLALLVSGVAAGDEVVTTPLTFAATANVIELVGARPVFVDVERHSQNIDPRALGAAISSRTVACVPVHMAGRPCDMDAITAVAGQGGLTVVEDAAHAVEAISAGRKIGSISDFTAFSFYATKNLTTGEGGMLACLNQDAADRVRTLRLHGLSRDAWRRYSTGASPHYQVIEAGFKYNMTDLQASLGIHQLARVEASLALRERYWAMYDDGLDDLNEIEIPAPVRKGDRHGRHLYSILIRPNTLRAGRDDLIKALHAEGIGAGVHFFPLHLHPYYMEKYGFRRGTFPNAEHIGENTTSLPLSPRLTEADVSDVIGAVRKVVQSYRAVKIGMTRALRRPASSADAGRAT